MPSLFSLHTTTKVAVGLSILVCLSMLPLRASGEHAINLRRLQETPSSGGNDETTPAPTPSGGNGENDDCQWNSSCDTPCQQGGGNWTCKERITFLTGKGTPANEAAKKVAADCNTECHLCQCGGSPIHAGTTAPSHSVTSAPHSDPGHGSGTCQSLVGSVVTSKDRPKNLPDSYQLVWSDEFDSNASSDQPQKPNTSNWRIWGSPGAPTFPPNGDEKEKYVDDLKNVYESCGVLTLKATNDPAGGKPYSSGRVDGMDKHDWQYGYFETRARAPEYGRGSWPAFWMLGHGGWPQCGEIDIMETAPNTHNNENVGSLHTVYHNSVNGKWSHDALHPDGSGTGATVPNGGKVSEWHTYAVLWTAETVEWFVDEESWGMIDFKMSYKGASASDIATLQNRKFFVMNMAFGGGMGGYPMEIGDGQRVLYDYVRVWQQK